MSNSIISKSRVASSQLQQSDTLLLGEKPIVYIDADGVLFNTPEFLLKKVFRDVDASNTEKTFIDALASISFLVLEMIPFISKFSDIIKNENVKVNNELLELAKKLKGNGIEVKILTANGETGFIRELMAKRQLDIEVIKCSKVEKAQKGGVLIDDSIVTYMFTKLYNHFSNSQTTQIIFSSAHNKFIAIFMKKLGGHVAKNSAEITESLVDLGMLKVEKRE